MRKLKLQIQLSIDGFVGGPNGELDWMVWDWDNELKEYINNLTEPVDTILLGRKMAGGFITYWTSVAANPGNPQHIFGKKMYDTLKIVFTKTLGKSDLTTLAWENTMLATGDLAEEIHEIKSQLGDDIIVYGGSNFVSALIKNNLIDEYYLFVNPSALGKGNGLSIFGDKTKFELVESRAFACGVVLLDYKR